MKNDLYDIKDKICEVGHIVMGIAVTIIMICFAIIAILLIIKIMQTL